MVPLRRRWISSVTGVVEFVSNGGGGVRWLRRRWSSTVESLLEREIVSQELE